MKGTSFTPLAHATQTGTRDIKAARQPYPFKRELQRERTIWAMHDGRCWLRLRKTTVKRKNSRGSHKFSHSCYCLRSRDRWPVSLLKEFHARWSFLSEPVSTTVRRKQNPLCSRPGVFSFVLSALSACQLAHKPTQGVSGEFRRVVSVETGFDGGTSLFKTDR